MTESSSAAPQRTRRAGQRMSEDEKRIAKETFLKALSNTANVRAACLQAGVDSSTIYRWQEHDEEFSFKFQQANKDASWLLYGEAWQRAMRGEEEYVVSGGKLIYGPDGNPLKVNKKSDRMLELLLKARLPEFRDKHQIDLNANINGQINSTNLISIDTRALTSDQLAKLKALAMDMKGGQQ